MRLEPDMAINCVHITGNLTRNSESRKVRGGLFVLNFGIAVNERKRDESGEWVDAQPVYVDCALFAGHVDKLLALLTKGQKVSIEGKLRYSSWMKDDEKRSKLSVVVKHVEFLGSRSDKRDDTADAASGAHMAPPEADVYDEDIPF